MEKQQSSTYFEYAYGPEKSYFISFNWLSKVPMSQGSGLPQEPSWF